MIESKVVCKMYLLDDFRESVRELREDIHDFFYGNNNDD